MLILGIETSCDETGLALYDSERGLLAHALHSQVALHAEYGGVVPELALGLVPVALLTPAPGWDGEVWSRFISISLAVALGASILGNGLWNRASQLMPLTMLGQMIVFETLFALVYGFIYEGRWPTGIEALAVVLMIVSVVWCVRAHRPVAEMVAEGDHCPARCGNLHYENTVQKVQKVH